jgi:hypothetical protein
MSVKKTVARSAIALGISALGLGVGLGTASADQGNGGQPCWPQNCQGATNAVTVDRITVETMATVASLGASGDRISGARSGWLTSGHGISAASTTPVGTISPSTGRGNVEPYFDNNRGAWGFWFLGLWIPPTERVNVRTSQRAGKG